MVGRGSWVYLRAAHSHSHDCVGRGLDRASREHTYTLENLRFLSTGSATRREGGLVERGE